MPDDAGDVLERNLGRLVRRHGVRLEPARVKAALARFLAGADRRERSRKFVGLAAAVLFCGTLWMTMRPSGRDPGFSEWIAEERALEAAPERAPGAPAFREITAESGLARILDSHWARFPAWLQVGATFADLDGDGQLDLHLAGLGDTGPAALGANDGLGRFMNVDPQAGIPRGLRHRAPLPCPGGLVCLAHDFDEDGKLDLLVSWHDNGGALYLNAGRPGRFEFRRADFLDGRARDLESVAVADLDRDGIADFLTSDGARGIQAFLGRGDGTFGPRRAVTIPVDLEGPAVIPVDLDGDGELEIVSRQTAFNAPALRRIFRNEGGLRFVAADTGLPETGSIHGVGDVNHDGAPDLICVEGRGVEIYLNDGRGRFALRPGAVRGLERMRRKPHREVGAGWGGAVVTDFDNDGKADVILSGKYFLYVLRGEGDGSFEVASDAWGLPTLAYGTVDEGVCFGDFDSDGRLDVVAATARLDDPRRLAGLFLNELPRRHWVNVKLVGKKGNRAATGAKVRILEPGTGKLLWWEQISLWGRQSFHSSYSSAVTERHYGLGGRDRVDVSVEFHPSGRRVEAKGVPADRDVVLREDGP